MWRRAIGRTTVKLTPVSTAKVTSHDRQRRRRRVATSAAAAAPIANGNR